VLAFPRRVRLSYGGGEELASKIGKVRRWN